MDLIQEKKRLEETFIPGEAVILSFAGVDGYDVYNCSLPFYWEGKRYMFGRVERREEWMRSWVRLFEQAGRDKWQLVPESMIYQLEDPYISIIHNELIFGGTHVRIKQGRLDSFFAYFYRGSDIDDLHYFTTGPSYMKDIRLVELGDRRIGVFSRPRRKDMQEKYGSAAMVGFTVINSLEDLNGSVIRNAAYIEGFLGPGQWGACNQAYLLASGNIGAVGHMAYWDGKPKKSNMVYVSVSFVLNPENNKVSNLKLIGSRKLFPPGASKKPHLADVVFTSGIVMRKDGKADLYGGLNDCKEGRMVIDYPFAGEGAIVDKTFFMGDSS
jgi:hypothetical protein